MASQRQDQRWDAVDRPPVEGVIFDCDGTLVDSEVISMQVLQQLCADQGLALSMEEAMASFAGNELAVVLQILESKLGRGLPTDFLDVFRSKQLAELEVSLTAIDGAMELVSKLKVPFCVASNAPISKVELCLETTSLRPYFPADRVFSAYTIERWKPEPDLFLQAAEAIGIPAANCVVVEDSLFGVDAGIAAGMHVIAFDPHSKLNDLPDGVVRVESLREIDQVPLWKHL